MTQKNKSKSAAVKNAPQPKRKLKAHSTLFIGIVCAAVSLAFIAKGISVQPQINQNKNTVAELNAKIEEEKQRQAEVDEMRDKADTNEYIEKVARDRLGMIKNDEIVFIDVSEK